MTERDENIASGIGSLFRTSLALAIAGCATPFILWKVSPDLGVLGFILSLGAAIVWVVLVAVGFSRYRKSAILLLIGTPAAMFWPFLLFMLVCCSGGGSL